jgi:hypothetical protein
LAAISEPAYLAIEGLVSSWRRWGRRRIGSADVSTEDHCFLDRAANAIGGPDISSNGVVGQHEGADWLPGDIE